VNSVLERQPSSIVEIIRSSAAMSHQLLMECERAKQQLSSRPLSTAMIEVINNTSDTILIREPLRHDDLLHAIKSSTILLAIEELFKKCEHESRFIESGSKARGEKSRLILTGGGAMISFVATSVANIMSRAIWLNTIPPNQVPVHVLAIAQKLDSFIDGLLPL
jgi:molecular chaperone DnaK (HSP70)